MKGCLFHDPFAAKSRALHTHAHTQAELRTGQLGSRRLVVYAQTKRRSLVSMLCLFHM